MNPKRRAVLKRIRHLEEAIAKAHEYLESDKHADWNGFRPLFALKLRNGKALPPHKDWIKSIFIPRRERALRKAEKALERIDRD